METIKKRISDLDPASQPLGGTELAEISQGGVSKKVTLTNIFGSGWWAALRAAFSSFVAPEATHATDSDTVGGETKAQLHDATKLTGAVPLASIPAELTGKNAATATVSASCSGNAETVTNLYHGQINGSSVTGAQIYAALNAMPGFAHVVIISGAIYGSSKTVILSHAVIVVGTISLIGMTTSGVPNGFDVTSSDSTTYNCSISW